MTPFSELIAAITPQGEAHVSADWQQGRTTYGGLSAALCVAGALRAVPGLPPLRSAQFAFVGPAAGDMKIVPIVLRQGKNSVFVGVDLLAEAGLATRATLCFGADRPSALRYYGLPAPAVPPPADCAGFFAAAGAPNFAAHFEILAAGGYGLCSAAPTPDMLVWQRHRDPVARAGLAGLIALADAIPPAAYAMFSAPAQISTMTWSIDMLQDAKPSAEGWHLMRSRGDHVGNGYSSQDMVLWDQAGAPVLAARQTVAVFV